MRVHKTIALLVLCLAVGTWIIWGSLTMSWVGNRPVRPDVQHPHAFQDHGLIYVTDADLALSRALLAATAVLGVIGAGLACLGFRRYGDAFDPRPPAAVSQ